MVHKGFSIFDMEVTLKGLSWIDGLCQKFEAICMEVDENPSLLLQETTKYVENQFSVIGANVRKFCAEVIQDMLPPTPEAAIKSLASNISVNFGGDFELSEKLYPEKLQPLDVEPVSYENFKQRFSYAGQSADCAIQFPCEQQEDNPILYQEGPSESEILEWLPSLSLDDKSLSEYSIHKDETQRQSLHRRRLGANICSNTSKGAYLAKKTPFVLTVAKHALGKEKGPEDKNDNQKNGDMCEVGKMQVNEHSTPSNDFVEIMEKSEEHYKEETRDCKENVEGHEEDGEKISTVVDTFITHPSLSEEEPFYEVLDGGEDENDSSAYWYESEVVQNRFIVDISTSNSLVDVDVEKRQHVENCDSDWEYL